MNFCNSQKGMPIFKTKSNDNISAANYLYGMKLFAPSVHCSYYSCFHLSKNFLCAKGKDYDSQYAECKALKSDSHNYIIHETKCRISDSLAYDRNMKKLKALRRKADYLNTSVTPKDADMALSTAKKTRAILGI